MRTAIAKITEETTNPFLSVIALSGVGNVKVEMGSLELLTQKVERLDKILPQLSGMQGTLHLENWTEETTNIVFDKKE